MCYIMDKIDEIILFFTDIFHLGNHYELPLRVVNALNALDRAERGELKSKLFHEAKRLGQGGDGLKAIRWLETSFDQIEKNSFRLHDVLFSPGQDIPENIAYHLSRAKRTIDLCVFTISDELLSQCLKAAHNRGVKVRLITDNNKMRDSGSQVKELARAGIAVKIDNSKYHMHNKFGLIDGRILFTGSYNWTYTAKQYNQENIVITTNYTIVHKFIDEFERLWDEMFTLRVKTLRSGQVKASVEVNGSRKELDFERNSVAPVGEANKQTDPPYGGPAHKHRKGSKPNARPAEAGGFPFANAEKRKRRRRGKGKPHS